jgi:Fic family protein
LIDEYDVFDAKAVLLERRWEAFKSSTFTSAEVYDSIGSSHVFPTTPRQAPSIASSRGAQKADFESQRQSLTEKLNEILQDDSCMITLEQFMMIHRCVLLETKGQSGVIRKSAAVGYASPRIYRVFLPYGEIETALQNLFDQVNCLENWQQRPLLCAYYTFAILVFYIHPFHDGNGRCARLVGNLIAKKMGYPGAFRALDKTIQLSEFLQKVLNTIDMLQNTRRARQARLISNRKENTSMWF